MSLQLSDCVKLCQLINMQAQGACRLKTECARLAGSTHGLEQALVKHACGSDAKGPGLQKQLKVLRAALQEAAAVISDCGPCSPVRSLLTAGNLHERATAAAQHLLQAREQLPFLAEPVVPEVHVEPGAAADSAAPAHGQAAAFRELVLHAQHDDASKQQLLQEVAALLAGHAGSDVAAAAPASQPLPVDTAALAAAVEDLRMQRPYADRQTMHLQLIVADVLEELLQDMPPPGLVCPLTQRLLVDPVVLLDSQQTYERAAIQQWLAAGNSRDPVSGEELTSPLTVPDAAAQQQAAEWEQQQQQRKQQRLLEQQRQRRRQQQRQRQVQRRERQPSNDLQNLPQLPESVLAAELAAHGGYQFVKQLPGQCMSEGSRALQVRCSRTNRLRTLLQLPRIRLQQLDVSQQQQLLREVLHAGAMHHPQMLQVQEVFVGPLHLHIVLEECSAGCLLDYPAKQAANWGQFAQASAAASLTAPPPGAPCLPPDFACWFFQQLVLAVHYCHTQGVTGLAIEAAVLKVTPSLPQPVVKLPTPLLAYGLAALLPEMTRQAAGTSSSEFRPPEQAAGAAAADAAQADMWACGVLLLKLLGGQASKPTQAQLQHWEQQSPGLGTLLCGLLQPDPAQRFSVGQVMQDPWFRQQLPGAADSMTQRFMEQPVRSNRQAGSEVEAVLALACGSTEGLLKQWHPHRHQQQQQQPEQDQDQDTALPLDRLLVGLVLQLHALRAAAAQLISSSSQAGTLPPAAAAAAVALPQLLLRMAVRVAAAATPLAGKQHTPSGSVVAQGQLLLLQQSCSAVLFRVQALLHALAAVRQQEQQELLSAAALVIELQAQAWGLLQAVSAGTASANSVWNSCHTTPGVGELVRGSKASCRLHKLPETAHAVAARGAAAAAAGQLLVAAALLPLLVLPQGPLSAWQPTGLEMLPKQQPAPAGTGMLGAAVLIQALAVRTVQQQQQLAHQQGVSSIRVVRSASELLQDLQCHAGQQQPPQPLVRPGGCIAFEASTGGQAVQLVGLAALCPSHSTKGGAQHGDPAAQAAGPAGPDLSLLSAARSPAAAEQLAATLQQLQATQQGWASPAPSLSSSGVGPMFVPIHAMSLDPPLLVLPQPAGGTLDQWISSRVSGVSGAAADFTATWGQGLPWPLLLQLLGNIAAALCILHQQQPAVVHGGVHAGAVHLLQQLPTDVAEQQQQQQQAAAGSRVCQLGLEGLLSQLPALSSCHPFLAAPEVLLATGPASPAADVYGFGVLMFQLATGWLPQQYTPGTDEQLSAVLWCRDMMAQAGSTSPLAAVQALARLGSQAGAPALQTGEWTPYGCHLPSEAALQALPAGYVGLMEQCLQRVAPARPCMQEVAARLVDAAAGGKQASGVSVMLDAVRAVQQRRAAGGPQQLPLSAVAGSHVPSRVSPTKC